MNKSKLLDLVEALREAGQLPECGIPEAAFGAGSRGEKDVNDHNSEVDGAAKALAAEIESANAIWVTTSNNRSGTYAEKAVRDFAWAVALEHGHNSTKPIRIAIQEEPT